MVFDPRQRRDGRPMRFQRPPFQQRRPEMPDDEEPDSELEQRGGSRESEYLRSLADEKKPVVVHLRTGETFRGFIEYYDRRFLRLTRAGDPNLFIFKQDITYLSEEDPQAEKGSPAKEGPPTKE
jgi:sRNA-binding regulator protein Hfq